MCHVDGEKIFIDGLNCLKKAKIVFKMKTSLTGPPKMVDSVNVFILVDKKVTTEDILKQLGISVVTTHKIRYSDVAFSKVSCCWISTGHCKVSYKQE